MISDEVRNAAESIIGNLDEDGYLTARWKRSMAAGEHTPEQMEEALRVVQSLDPAGVGARNLRECLLLQIESMNGRGGVALADRFQPSAAAGDPPVQGNREGCWAGPWSTSKSPCA